jgi:hypothetical protein
MGLPGIQFFVDFMTPDNVGEMVIGAPIVHLGQLAISVELHRHGVRTAQPGFIQREVDRQLAEYRNHSQPTQADRDAVAQDAAARRAAAQPTLPDESVNRGANKLAVPDETVSPMTDEQRKFNKLAVTPDQPDGNTTKSAPPPSPDLLMPNMQFMDDRPSRS